MDAWFYVTEGRTEGPLPLDELRRRLATGVVAPSTLVWEPSLPGWRPALSVPILLPLESSGPSTGAPPMASGIPPFPMASLSQAAPAPQPSTAPVPGAFDGAGPRADAGQLIASVHAAAPHRKGARPRSRLGVLFATFVAVALVGLAALAIQRVPGLKGRVFDMLAELQEKLTPSSSVAPQQPATGQAPPLVVPPIADPAAGPSANSGPDSTPLPTGAPAAYRCPLEIMNAESQAPRKLGLFERTDLTVEEPNPDKQWAYFYTCRYQHPKLGTVGHKVLTFEKYRGETLAAEYTRAAVENLKPTRRLIHQEDVVAPKTGGRLGRIFVFNSKTGSDVIWHNGRHFLHIEAPTTQLALEFKKQLAY